MKRTANLIASWEDDRAEAESGALWGGALSLMFTLISWAFFSNAAVLGSFILFLIAIGIAVMAAVSGVRAVVCVRRVWALTRDINWLRGETKL